MEDIRQAVLTGDEEACRAGVQRELDARTPAQRILDEGLVAGMDEVGRLFRDGEYFLPEVLVAADAMHAGMRLLQPHLAAANVKPMATAVVGTVAGDLHDIGKNLVATMLQGAGFAVIDLGVDVPAEKFVEACRAQPVQLVALSALLTTTMPQMQTIVQKLRAEADPPPIVLIGGAPVSERYAQEIGADGYGPDAATGAQLAKRLIQARPQT